ncbi:hypothetical protein BO71DRAFT_455121, partial [Aspergillus ellipticus CBS 707.79]
LGWKAYDQVHQALNEFNKAYNLPLGWNISPTAAETVFGHRPPPETSLQAASVQRDSGSESSEDESIDGESESEGGSQGDEDDGLSGIDLLETRARQQSRSLVNAKVLFWWSKGAGTQIFVRYGPRSNPIFRIRAGTHEYYDKKTVTRVLVSKTRGYMKKPAVMDGISGETWKYERKHVSDILGVGWKIEDDDESRIDPLALIEPATGVMYPETRVFVAWKDGEKTLETRAFIRRIANGSNLDGDRLIFQKAKELEGIFRENEEVYEPGISEPIGTYIGESERQTLNSRRLSPTRSTRSVPHSRFSNKNSVRFQNDEESISDISEQIAPSRTSRKSTPRPSIASHPINQRQSVGSEDPRDREIRILREQVEQLNMSQSWQGTKMVPWRPIYDNHIPFNDRASTVSSKPPIPPLRRSRRGQRVRQGAPWNHWGYENWDPRAALYY